MEEIKQSPNFKPQPRMGMDFPSAMRQVLEGKKITRLEWASSDEYGLVRSGFLMIHRGEDNKDHQWIVSEADIRAMDWIVCGEHKEMKN